MALPGRPALPLFRTWRGGSPPRPPPPTAHLRRPHGLDPPPPQLVTPLDLPPPVARSGRPTVVQQRLLPLLLPQRETALHASGPRPARVRFFL
eukprot:gene12317-biopygen406